MSVSRILTLLMLSWVSLSAQNPAEAPPGVPVPDTNPPPPAGAPAAPPAANPPVANPANLGETKIVEDIIEKKLSGEALAGLYRRYTGRRVIVTTAAATAEFAFVQEASPQDPLTYAEAAELLRKAAVLEGFVFTEHPQDPNLDILTIASGGTTNRGVKLDVYNENTPLPDTDVVITYVMTLQYIKPDQALNIFTQIVGQFGAYGSISAVPNASAVVITEKASLIKSLVDLQKTIDVPGSVQKTKFIKVQYADVTEIATVLTELLTAQQSTQKTAGVQRADNNAAAPPGLPGQAAAAGGGTSGGGEETPVQIVPEPRTNRIFAMGRPVDLLFVEGLVREFDVPTSEKTFLRRKLRFLTVSDFLPIAGDALTRAFTGTGEGGSGGGSSASTQGARTQSSARQTSSGTTRSSGMSGSSSSSFGSSGSSSSGFGSSSGSGGGSSLGDPNVSSAPESLLVGRTLLVADNITNSVVAQGPPSALEIIERLLDQIDVKPDQVMISTVIGQLTLNKTNEFGMDYLVRGGDVVGRGGGGFGPVLPILETITDSTDSTDTGTVFNPGSLSGGGLRVYGKIGDLNVYLNALQSKTDFTVLSRPSIFTSNNQKGVISSGERIAIPTEGGTNTGTYSSGTRIEYQDVVLKLEVIPLVNSNNEITMQIALLSDEQNGEQIIEGAGTDGGNLTVPRISTREIITTATVPNNDTIVLGGLIVGKDNQTKSGVPILSDIPYLGRLFSSTEDTTDRSELMVFLQPSIVSNDRSLTAVQNDMDARYTVSPKVRNFADGDSVLPGVGEIPEKGKGGGSTRATRESSTPSGAPSKMKPSLRPSHRP